MPTVEERLSKMERELEELKQAQVMMAGAKKNWLDHTRGRFKGSKEFEEIVELADELRRNEPPAEDR